MNKDELWYVVEEGTNIVDCMRIRNMQVPKVFSDLGVAQKHIDASIEFRKRAQLKALSAKMPIMVTEYEEKYPKLPVHGVRS